MKERLSLEFSGGGGVITICGKIGKVLHYHIHFEHIHVSISPHTFEFAGSFCSLGKKKCTLASTQTYLHRSTTIITLLLLLLRSPAILLVFTIIGEIFAYVTIS